MLLSEGVLRIATPLRGWLARAYFRLRLRPRRAGRSFFIGQRSEVQFLRGKANPDGQSMVNCHVKSADKNP